MIAFKEEHLENIWRVCHGLAEKAYGYRLELSKGHEYYNLTAKYLNLIGEVHRIKGTQREIRDNDPTVPALLDFRMSKGYQVLSVNAPSARLLYQEPEYFEGMSFGNLLTEPSQKTWKDLVRDFLGSTPFEFAATLQFKVNLGLSYISFCYVNLLADGTIMVSSFEKDHTGQSYDLMRFHGISPNWVLPLSSYPALEKLLPKEDVEKEQLQKIARYLEGQTDRSMPNIGALSYRFGLNEKKLYRGFKRTVGQTPFAFYMDAKLKRALELLQTTTMGIDEIGESLGYRTLSGFYKAFKRRFGMNPGEVKRER